MPELPEVETIKNQVSDILPFVIDAVEYSPVVNSILKEKNKLFDPSGMTINALERHGKMLIFQLSSPEGKQFFITSHLGMSGSWRISKEPLSSDIKHVHLVFHGYGKTLSYVDPRRFGNLYFLDKSKAKEHLSRLGVDVSSHNFTVDYLLNLFRRFPAKQLKPFLLDQKYFAGVGNYIACEICARARVRPTRKCGKITKNEAQQLLSATHSILSKSIKSNGMTFSGGYQDAFGNKGEGVKNLVVFYQKICGICEKTPVKKIVLQGRGTYYCPSCQK